MNVLDPSAPANNGFNVLEEVSVEDVALADAMETPEELLVAPPPGEPTAAPAGLEAAEIAPAPRPPITPVPVKRRVTGRYVSHSMPWKLELRVDVDGYRPLKRISGDFYHVSGATTSYFGSFVVHAPTLSVTDAQVTIIGLADTTWPTRYNKLRLVIPRHTIFQPPASAYAQWMTANDQKGAAYSCPHDSPYLRSVDLEEDREEGVTPFVSYHTGSLPSGGPARVLTVAKAYEEAGIQMRTAGTANVISTSEAGANAEWSNSELHAAMVEHFSLWREEPQWKVWLFHALRHEIGPGLLGIMFDQEGKQRQGCAAFYQRIAGTAPEKLRDQLYVCVHELGHCFNLFHSFHKRYMDPPQPNRPAALSWMNYPQNYPAGAAAFWSAFPFQFDDLELIHLRHAFRDNIIIGGNPFGTGAALEDPQAFAGNVVDNSGLRLELETRDSFALGEPVVTEIKLYTTDLRGKRVHRQLHPNFGFVQLAVQQPGGESVLYHPPMEHCVEVETVLLDAANPAIYESAYIGYGKERGQLFAQPGVYKLRAAYYALDGSVVFSNVLSLRVRSPLNAADEEVADLLLGDEQGMLFYLLGSDSKSLENGNQALDLVLDKHGEHPLAVYARLAKGINAMRAFKTISDNRLAMRKPHYEEAEGLLSGVVDVSEAGRGVDNITLNMTLQCMARAQSASGKSKEAKATVKRMVDIFKKKSLKPHVLSHIEAQAENLRKTL